MSGEDYSPSGKGNTSVRLARRTGISLEDCEQSIKRIAVDVIPPAGLIFLRRLITPTGENRFLRFETSIEKGRHG